MFDFDTPITRRGTGSLKWDRRPDLQPFWVADMDFQSPPAVIEVLQDRVAHGIFGYAVPHRGLVEAVVEYISQRHKVTVSEEQIVHLGGLVPALSLAGRAFASPGDALMTCSPVYPPFLGIHRDSKLELVSVSHAKDQGKWVFDWERMEEAITERTRLFVLSHPQNPLGRVFTEEEILRLAEFCDRHDLLLVSDEIHCDLILDEEKTPFFSALRLPDALRQRTVTLLSPSKTYNIAGLGYAYAVIPDAKRRRLFTHARGHTLAEINCLSYYGAEAAYREGEPWRQELLAYLRGNRDLLLDFCHNELPGLVPPDQEATYLAWLDFRPLEIPEPAARLEEAGLFLSNGRDFGHPGHARLNFGCPRTLLRQALDVIRDTFVVSNPS